MFFLKNKIFKFLQSILKIKNQHELFAWEADGFPFWFLNLLLNKIKISINCKKTIQYLNIECTCPVGN